MVDDDTRDERLAAWLEPGPLDEVTRRRLVSTAMRQSRDSHALRWIATAAAIVVVLVGVLALVTAKGGNDEHRAAAPARTPAGASASSDTRTSGQAAGQLSQEAAPSAAPPVAPGAVDLGDFGNLDRAANLSRLRNALDSSAPGSSFSASAKDATAVLAPLPCRDRLPAGTILAVATGTLDGRRAVVTVIDVGNGSRAIDAVLADPCEVRKLS